jgi:CRISPR-associated protein Cas2
MHVLIIYDIEDNRLRSRLHRKLKAYGVNSQKSVFEFDISKAQLDGLVAFARELIDDQDSFRVYLLCRKCSGKVMISGVGEKLYVENFAVL